MVVVPVATNIDEIDALEVCEEDLDREVGDHDGSLLITFGDGNWGDLVVVDEGLGLLAFDGIDKVCDLVVGYCAIFLMFLNVVV